MVDLKKLEFHKLAQGRSNETWTIVKTWPFFDRDTLGKQFVRSADSVRANVAEAGGRYSYIEKVRFCHIARGSLVEYRSHLEAARKRGLVTAEQEGELETLVERIAQMLNGFIRYLRSQVNHT